MSDWHLGPYRALDHTFAVRGALAGVVRERLAHALGPLTDPGAEHGPESGFVYYVEDAGSSADQRYTVRAGSGVLIRTSSTTTAAGYVIWHVNGSLVKTDRGRHLILHAAGVRRAGITVALPAPMESGKTTTCAGLLRVGFEYLTDEALVIDRHDGSITPFPKALSLDRGSRSVLGDLRTPPYRNADADDQWQVPWWDLGAPGVASGAPIDAIILPGYRLGSDTALEAVGPGEALLALADSTFDFRRRPRANLDLLASLVETRPVYRLRIGALAPAVALVETLVDSLARDGEQPQECSA